MLCISYVKSLNLVTSLVIVALLYIFLLRRWALKKTLSFAFTILVLFIVLVRVEAYLLATFGAEGSNIGIGVVRTVFFVLAAVVLIYNAAVKD